MTWQPMLYCFSLGTLITSIVASAFTPICRRRKQDQPRRKPVAVLRQALAADHERVAEAMRQWSTARAQNDMTYVVPPPPPAPPEPEPPAPVIETRAVQPPPRKPVEETKAAPEAESQSVAEPNPFLNLDFQRTPNFYEILQISPRADMETIHRVYRIMAARFHPDNPVSGDHEIFLKLCEAYEVLSCAEQRAQYDCALRAQETKPMPIFGTRIFVDGLDGELNRRFGVMALLYQRRRMNQGGPGISTLDLESRMALPREHLEFTLWYLRMKGYVQVLEENSDYAVTAAGVDYVEANSSRNPILRELLTAGDPMARPAQTPAKRGRKGGNPRARRDHGAVIAV